MALLRFISLVAGCVVLLRGGYGQGVKNQSNFPDPIVVSADDCLESMNEARAAVGYTPFTATANSDKKIYPIPPPNNDDQEKVKKFWKTVCRRVQGAGRHEDDVEIDARDTKGTVVYYPQEKKDCAPAVEYWKGGFSKLGSALPPALGTTYEEIVKGPYASEEAVFFVALYSPKKNANAECVFLTCPAYDRPANQGDADRSPLKAPEIKVLGCVVHPAVLEPGKQPYKEEEWKKIVDVFAPESSASVATPTFLALATAAVGLVVI